MGNYMAVDVGGTQLRAAIYPEEGLSAIVQKRIPTKSSNASAIDRLMTLIEECKSEVDGIQGIGVAAPGPIDPRTGIFYSAPNIRGWENLPLRDIISDRFKVPVALGNDANMAALGEWKYGAGEGHHNVLYLTISTGIGGGVIIDDQLLLGEHGLAAELGHIVIMPDGPICGCGHRGHLEAISSGTGIANYVAEELARGVKSCLSLQPRPTARDISKAALDGDSLSLAAFTRAGTYLGIALAGFCHAFNPSIIILGGGVSRSGAILMDPVKKALEVNVISPAYLTGLILTTASLGDDAGLLGALALARSL
jgi:glucokinase